MRLARLWCGLLEVFSHSVIQEKIAVTLFWKFMGVIANSIFLSSLLVIFQIVPYVTEQTKLGMILYL